MSFFNTASSASSSTNTQGDLKGDVELTSPPEDGISDLCFSPASNHLAVASWDKKVRIYEISPQGQSQGKAMYEHEGPVLSVHWSKDGSKVVSGGADKAARLYDIQSGQSTQVAAHDSTIKCVRFIDAPNAGQMLVTGSWDKTLKYWDLRSSTPAATLNLPERCYTMDVQQQLLVVGTAERHIAIVNLQSPTQIYKSLQSPLKWQTRVVSCFPSANGFAVGSIEGRCAIQYVEDKDSNLNFSFKCHRDNTTASGTTNVYSVNSIAFHPVYGTFSTAGADGTFHFWDKDAKHRLKGYPHVGGTISATNFSKDGSIFAYAVSYDWSKGHQANTPNLPVKVMLHPVREDEAKPRTAAKKR